MLRVLIVLVSLGARTIRAMWRRRADLVIENVALRQQVAVLKKELPSTTRTAHSGWRSANRGPGGLVALVIVNADTVGRWIGIDSDDTGQRSRGGVIRDDLEWMARFAGSSGRWLRMVGAHRAFTRSSRSSVSSCPR